MANSTFGCPTAVPVVLSEDYIQPALEGRWVASGVTQPEYTIGIEGCNKRETDVVMCQDGRSTCFAASLGGVQYNYTQSPSGHPCASPGTSVGPGE